MELSFSASTVKAWFQYRCERKIVYEAMPGEARAHAIHYEPPTVVSPWAVAGTDFEKAVIRKLRRELPGQVFMPPPGHDRLDEAMTRAFLMRDRRETYAHQVLLQKEMGRLALPGLPANVALRNGYLDLVRVDATDDGPVYTIIDIKATQAPTLFHKAQVAFYALVLEATLRAIGAPGKVAPQGEIWHLVDFDGKQAAWKEVSFPLQGYRQMIVDFFKRTVPAMSTRRVDASGDDTRFHLYFKCEQCEFLPHCEQAIADTMPAAHWDVSAVPGLTHGGKATLAEMGVHTVAQLAARPHLPAQAHTWALRTKGKDLVVRAQALLDGRVARLPERYSNLMPPRTDLSIHLAVDQNPMDGCLSALGCRLQFPDGRLEEVVEVVERPEGEAKALVAVLGKVVEALSWADAENRQGAGLHAHLFLYEPSEGADLQLAIGRNLTDEQVRNDLLHLVRMFPPADVVPEPEYRGVHHLPLTALRSVVGQLLALPVKVSMDLARVTQALRQATTPIETAYVPLPEFARPFSSRLSIDVAQDLRLGRIAPEAVAQDVRDRLAALDALRRWFQQENQQADPAFLHLRKRPFQFQSSFDPLGPSDLDLLAAQEVLESRAAWVSRLTELAQPAEVRRDRLKCLAGLRLLKWGDNKQTGWRKKYWMRFAIPESSRQADLGAGNFSLILTDNHPDLLLDIARWPALRVQIKNFDPGNTAVFVVVNADVFEGPEMQRLLQETPDGGWYIDESIADYNTRKVQRFFEFLASKES